MKGRMTGGTLGQALGSMSTRPKRSGANTTTCTRTSPRNSRSSYMTISRPSPTAWAFSAIAWCVCLLLVCCGRCLLPAQTKQTCTNCDVLDTLESASGTDISVMIFFFLFFSTYTHTHIAAPAYRQGGHGALICALKNPGMYKVGTYALTKCSM